MKKKQILVVLTSFICLMAFGLGVGFYAADYYETNQVPEIQGLLWPNPKQIQTFATTDHTGKPFGLNQLKDHWSFIFFGYTNCPDICPITLSTFNQIYAHLVESGHKNIQMIFVTVDPERDTTKQLAHYVNYFNEKFVGLGGTAEQVQSLAGQIGIVHMHSVVDENGDYLVDHSASVFLTDPQARLVSIFSAPHIAEPMTNRFKEVKHFITAQTNG